MDKFAYAIGRLRSLEKDLLDESRLVRITEAPDLQSAYQVLREIPHYEAELAWTKALLLELAPGNELITAFWHKYEPGVSLQNHMALLKQTAKDSDSLIFRRYAKAFITLNSLKLDLLAGKIDADTALAKYKYSALGRAVTPGLEEYKKTGSLAALERETDNEFLTIVRPAKYMAFGIEPLLGFAVAKEIEIKLIRLVLVTKQLGLKTNELRGRLRLTYA
ncbi:MAG: V-type ATPase subunit [Candidatus Margulisiibacteriota bacterium]